MSGKGPPRELGYVGADTGGQPGQAGDALDAEFSRSLPGSCGRSPGVTARGVSLGDSSQTRAGTSISPGQAGGWTLHRPSLPASRSPSDREETCAKCGSQRGGLCSSTRDACPPHPSLQPPAPPSRCPAEELRWHHHPPPRWSPSLGSSQAQGGERPGTEHTVAPCSPAQPSLLELARFLPGPRGSFQGK